MINPQPNFQNISDPLGYYTILGISPEADAALVKQSYRDLAKSGIRITIPMPKLWKIFKNSR